MLAESPDRKIRVALFVLLLVGGMAFYVANRVAKERWTYDMAKQVAMPYDAYGLAFGRIPPKLPGKTRLLLLGNSAYELYGVALALKDLAARDPREVEVVNLAQAGAGIADHVVQGAFALAEDARPDLVVLTIGSFSFGDLGFTYNTECFSVPFEPRVAQYLTSDFYRRQYDVHSGVDAAVGALLPVKQLDPIVRYQYVKTWPAVYQRRLALPNLNRIAAEFNEYYKRGKEHVGAAWLQRPLRADYAVTCDELLAMFAREHIPVLVIREPCTHYPMSDVVAPYLYGLEARWPGVRFVDLESEWQKENYMDQIHPLLVFAPTYAKRHYDLMVAELDRRRGATTTAPSTGNGS